MDRLRRLVNAITRPWRPTAEHESAARRADHLERRVQAAEARMHRLDAQADVQQAGRR